MHRSGDDARLALAGGSDDLPSKAAGEHEGLSLQGAVEQPEHAESPLEVAAGGGTAPCERRDGPADAARPSMCGESGTHGRGDGRRVVVAIPDRPWVAGRS